jgi:ferredoxin
MQTMPTLKQHPTVQAVRRRETPLPVLQAPPVLDAGWLCALALEAGADDAGLVELDRPEVEPQREDIRTAMPHTQTLLSFVLRMNREAIRSPLRSISNVEFHHTGDEVNEVGRRIARALEQRGIRALNVTMGFPMEMDRWPGKTWVVSHKPIAVAAGLGKMGIHRNVIHPRFGNFILLGTVLLEATVTRHGQPLDYNPCLECKLCVSACPTGAIKPDGQFDFSACYTHNYREFMGGFTDWVENIAESRNAADYRQKVSDAETVSMWQSLGFGPNYKAAYCLSVCPAGEEVIAPFLADRKQFLAGVVKPLQEKAETVYVAAGSDAEAYVARRFPRKRTQRVHGGVRPNSIPGFLRGLPLTFQREASAGLDAIYHFTFTGEERRDATVEIRDKTLRVTEGHAGQPSLRITADSRTWLRFLAREISIVRALLRGKIRIRGGSPKLLLAFGRCFPS